ncbi:hypothetical protein [Streptomyces vilmorinianum]|uniref:hypothetical protein n=1 Tax=Streptomyces vilmorinianum TaxID=3051092 RepID=UPI0010FB508F|nr:hypothetical protein [Streptomyces vilmorinianum]
MSAILILFGSLGGIGLLLVILLLRRSSSRTGTVDGLRIEHEARRQAQIDRISYNARSVHNSMPTSSDSHQQRHRRG